MWSAKGLTVITTTAVLLAGCEGREGRAVVPPRPAPAPLRAPVAVLDEATIATAIKERLEARSYTTAFGTFTCGQDFLVGRPQITARRVKGDAGEVEATMLITSSQAWPERSDQTDRCFGSPPGGWPASRPVSYKETFKVERWDTGWRLGPGW
jgi:hypothetical protein